MKSLLTQIQHAKITAREVLIHLRKNGELKRKPYLKYLKMQYRVAGNTYELLQFTDKSIVNNSETPFNTPNDKKLTMPVHLVRSEISTMSKSFEDIGFLTEAWHFYQKEMMRNSSVDHNFVPVSKLSKVSEITVTNNTKSKDQPIWNNNTHSQSTNNSLTKTIPQSPTTLTLASGFDKLNQHYKDPRKNTPLCIQILKWAQEGKLNLN